MLLSLLSFFPSLSSLALSAVFFFSGSSTPPVANTRPVTPAASVVTCGEVPKAQIEAAIGEFLNPGTEELSKLGSICTYSTADISVTISIQHLTQALDLPAELEKLKTTFPGSELREVKGLAARAFALEIPDAGTQLHIVSDEREYFMVSVLGLQRGHHGFDAAEKIARAVVGRR